MDETPLHYNTGLTLLSNGGLNAKTYDNDDYAIPYLYMGSSGGTKPSVSKGYNKEKWNIANDSSLALGLGSSSTSCITTTSITTASGRGIRDESLDDLDLRIDLTVNNVTSSSRNYSYVAANALDVRKPEIDLELSLSTVAAESGITVGSGNGSILHDIAFLPPPPPSLSANHFVDDGLTSSSWKRGPLLTQLFGSEIISAVNQTPNLSDVSNISASPVKATESSPAFTSGVVHQEQRRTNVKICRYEGCVRGARGASGFCIAHGGGRRCQRMGCQKGAEGRTVFCKAHGGGRRCQYLGCTKSAEGRTEYCIGHGGGRRCNHEGCSRAARGKSGLCIRHGGGKRCKIENCSKSAEGITGLCISHGGGRRCQYPDCTKGSQGSTIFCKAHGGGRRCTYLGCTKGAEGSTPFCKGHGGGKRCTSEGCTKSVHGGTLFCVSHGGGKRCASSGCTKSARGRTDFCVRHGGGKRCKTEGCTKSAQGSTDYCKAHGGGKRCSWGQYGYGFQDQYTVPCDKFARGKSGLCASHAAQIEETSNGVVGPTLEESQYIKLNNISHDLIPARLNEFSLPEGRVHGGSLMAMLRGNGGVFSQTGNTVSECPFEHRKSFSIPRTYV